MRAWREWLNEARSSDQVAVHQWLKEGLYAPRVTFLTRPDSTATTNLRRMGGLVEDVWRPINRKNIEVAGKQTWRPSYVAMGAQMAAKPQDHHQLNKNQHQNSKSSVETAPPTPHPAFMCMCACVHVCHSNFLLPFISLCHTLFPFLYVHMGSDVWMRPLGPVAAEGAAWLHFHSVAEALRFLHSEAGGSLQHLKHTPVARAAKSDGTRDGYSFTLKEPVSMVVARLARPQPAATPTLASFGLTAVRCARCGANICGRGRAGKKSPGRRNFNPVGGGTSVAVEKRNSKS